MTGRPRTRPARPLRAALALLLSAAGLAPASGAASRPLIFLDGDSDSRTVDSEDVLLTQSPASATTTEFGSAVAFGYVNDDGYADAVVGQRTQNKVFIYLGSALPRPGWFDDPNLADIVVAAPSGTSDRIQQFGFSVAAFDVDATSSAIIVGAPFSDPNGKTDAGLAYVVILDKANLPSGVVTVAPPSAGVGVVKLARGAASKAGDHLGFAVGAGRLASLNDFYLVVSARDADATTPAARADAGAAHVVLGSALGGAGGSLNLSTDSAVTIFGTDASDALGESVALCDVDDDDDDDLFMGAVFGDGPGNAGINRGEALVFLGANIASGYHAGTVAASSAELTVYGADDGDDLGYTVGCGDVNGDGRADAIAGAIFADSLIEARPSAGEVYVLRGRASQTDPGNPARRILIDPRTSAPQTPVDLSVATDPNDPAPDGADLALFGATTADEFGFSIGVGDLDGDGVGDLVAGARRYDRDRTLVNAGATYVWLGSAGFLDPAGGQTRGIDLHRGEIREVDPNFVDPNFPGSVDFLPDRVDGIIIGASRDDHSSWALATGDIDGDGADDLMISAIGDLARAPGFRGEAYILSYSDLDGDGASDLIDLDNDNDGIPDADEAAGTYTDPNRPTEPFDPDTDGDGVQDGTELGFNCTGGALRVACDDPNTPFTSIDPNLPLHFRPDLDPATNTDPLDADTDDDGLTDGEEDADFNGRADTGVGETDAADHDTDGDSLFDALELGRTAPTDPASTDLAAGHFAPDADSGASITDPTRADTDSDGIDDGVEDADRDGAVAGDADLDHMVDPLEVWAETDPSEADTDSDGVGDGTEDRNRDGAIAGDANANRILDAGETWTEASPLDQDTDDDGLGDGVEDADGDGNLGPSDGESSPLLGDTDGDGLPDGTEAGLMAGGGLNGRNGTPDGGPGGDGTDVTSPFFVPDADSGLTRTDPRDTDTENDGLPDGFIGGFGGEDVDLNGALDAGETNPLSRDSDGDGITDGVERGVVSPGAPQPGGTTGGGVLFDADPSTQTDPLDADTDDDGLTDGQEDNGANGGNGKVDAGESDPDAFDTDADLLFDGLESGLTAPTDPNGTNLSAGHFVADADPSTVTSPALADTDSGGATDGDEDASLDGKVDSGERNPNVRGDDDRTGVLEFTDTLNGTTTTSPVAPGSPLFVRLDDDVAKNLDPNVAETLAVSCASDFSPPDTEVVTLAAVGPNSGVFAGTLPTNSTDPNIAGELTIAPGNTITCTFVDPLDAVDTRTAMLAAALTSPPVIPQFDVDLPDAGTVTWSAAGPSSLQPGQLAWNLYRGEMVSLRSTGVYTQIAVGCGLTVTSCPDSAEPPAGVAFFYLAAGVSDGVEGSLGADSAGRPRSSTEPCAP